MAATTPRKQTTKKQTPAKPNPFAQFRDAFDHHATVDVYAKWMLTPRFHELNEAAAAIAERLGVDHPDALEAARQAAEVREEIGNSKIDVKVRAITRAEFAELVTKAADENYDYLYDQLAMQVSEPKGTPEEWRDAETWMGPHFTRVAAVANLLIDNEGVVPDFSPATLATLSTQNSSQLSESPGPTESDSPSSTPGTTTTE